MAVAAAGVVSVGCSSSSDSDDSGAAGASAGETGSAGKSGSGSGGAGTDVTSDAGAAGAVSETTAAGGAVDPGPEPEADAGAGGTGAGTDPGPVGEAGAGGSPPVVPDPKAAAIARAKKMIAGLEMPCTSCHQGNYAGANYWPNITPDEDTGIGAWSDEDIKKAITQGIGIDDHVFCAEMQRFKWTESQLDDVVTFLHSLKPVSKTIAKVCTTK